MAQDSRYAHSLASKLVRDHYGDITEKVVSVMLQKGRMNFTEIVRACGLPGPQVKQALLVLMQHNCVAAYLQKDEEGIRNPRPPTTLYQAQSQSILQILRYPKFLLHISDEMERAGKDIGEIAEGIIALLLEHGRLRLEQVTQGVAGKLGKPWEEVQDPIRNVFISLVQSHYVERAPPCTLPPPIQAPHPNSVKRRGGAKAGTDAYAAEQAGALKQLDEVVYEKQRFKLPQELVVQAMVGGYGDEPAAANMDGLALEDGPAEEEVKAPPAKKQKIKAGQAKPATAGAPTAAAGKTSNGSAAKHAPASRGLFETKEPAVLLWRVNPEEFCRRFRHSAIVEMVHEKLDQDAATVVAAMLNASRSFETKLQEERSIELGEEEVSTTCNKLIDSGVLQSLQGMADVPEVIRTVAADSIEMVSYTREGPGGSMYTVNMQRVVDLMRLKQLEAVVRDRFGLPGLRVFRLLLIRGQLEQKQIADIGMMPQKETRELLYRMLKGGFVATQDIPKTSERAPSRTFYTWRVDVRSASDRLAADLYRAAQNVWCRLKHEMDKEKELIELIETAKETGQLNFTLTEKQRKNIKRLKGVSEVLETSLMQIDDMICVYNDY